MRQGTRLLIWCGRGRACRYLVLSNINHSARALGAAERRAGQLAAGVHGHLRVAEQRHVGQHARGVHFEVLADDFGLNNHLRKCSEMRQAC